MAAGCDEVGLSDTTGYANPAQVQDLVDAVRAAVGDARALRPAPAQHARPRPRQRRWPGLEVGITTFDSSLGGLGGCPFAPGASGNIVTEDLVFMLEAMGLRTGIDLRQAARRCAHPARGAAGEPLYGFTPDAGLPLGFSRLRATEATRERGETTSSSPAPRRCAGMRVVEFTHMVMGPAVGAILVELGAEVIKVEPVGGDATRQLLGSGAGYFPMYNRNKKSVCLNLKDPRGLALAQQLARLGRRGGREFPRRHDGQARARLRGARGAQSAADLLLGEGLPLAARTSTAPRSTKWRR